MKKNARRAAPSRTSGVARKVVKARPAAKVAGRAGKKTKQVAARPRKLATEVVATPAIAPAPVVAAAAAPASDAFFLKLDASCTLRDTADLQFSLVAANGDPVVVDGSAVERVDTAGLQLLVALVRRQQQLGSRLEWQAASPELMKCGKRLGLIDALGLAGAGVAP